MKKKRWLIVAIFVIVVAAVAAGAYLWFGRSTTSTVHYLTAKATKGTISQTVSADFTLSSANGATSIALGGGAASDSSTSSSSSSSSSTTTATSSLQIGVDFAGLRPGPRVEPSGGTAATIYAAYTAHAPLRRCTRATGCPTPPTTRAAPPPSTSPSASPSPTATPTPTPTPTTTRTPFPSPSPSATASPVGRRRQLRHLRRGPSPAARALGGQLRDDRFVDHDDLQRRRHTPRAAGRRHARDPPEAPLRLRQAGVRAS